MRTKREILEDVIASYNFGEGQIVDTKLFGKDKILIEVLIDIRDLLTQHNSEV